MEVIHPPDRAVMDRRIEIGEFPLVSGDLPVRVLELLEQEDPKLVLGILRVDQRDGYTVEGQVPGGEPRIFPLVRHRHDAHRIEVPPVLITILRATGGWRASGVPPPDDQDSRVHRRRIGYSAPR